MVHQLPGTTLIHASKTRSSYDREAKLDWDKVCGVKLPPWEEMVTGAILGVVELVDCLPASSVAASPWVEGPVCSVLAKPRAFAEPVAWRRLNPHAA